MYAETPFPLTHGTVPLASDARVPLELLGARRGEDVTEPKTVLFTEGDHLSPLAREVSDG
jgi:hypothetical protein